MEMRRRHTLIGAMMIHRDDAEGMICGTFGTYGLHLQYIDQVIGLRPGAKHFYAMNALMLPKRTVFICDTYVNLDPSAEQLAEMTALAAEYIRRFGVVPRAALLSHSRFGTSDAPSARCAPHGASTARGENGPQLVVAPASAPGEASSPYRIRKPPRPPLRGPRLWR